MVAPGGEPPLGAAVGVAVHGQGGAAAVDRFAEEVAAEERVDLEPFAVQRVGAGGVVQQRHLHVGVEPGQRPFQPLGQAAGVGHEELHLRLAELGAAGPDEAAAEALGAGHPDGRAVDRHDDRVAFQHRDADPFEDGGDLAGPVGVVVVVAEHGHHRHGDAGQLLGQRGGFLRRPDPGQVAGQQQQVGPLVQVLQVRPQRSGGVGPEVDVSHGGDVDHRSAPRSSSAVAGGSGRSSRIVVALSIS